MIFSLVFSFLLGFPLLVGWYFTTEGQLFGLSSIDMSYFLIFFIFFDGILLSLRCFSIGMSNILWCGMA